MPSRAKEIAAFAKECEGAVKSFAEQKGYAVAESSGGFLITPAGQEPILVRLNFEAVKAS